IKTADDVTTPGSSTKHHPMPTCDEMEEFFASLEKQEQRNFADKYNFDVVNDLPLPGRFEWVKIRP
ncbi:cyclin-dependent kinase inhibitor 3, partial [Genlisea aurea]